ncbi:ABC transporter permease [Embleya sp. NBC_00896]|uniref:ABC transporter permease n=1 Tax=Embleya sp. NBC_00896 TaxID=2975961 RepID=UPI0038661F6A|nr:ABC-2 family transporter protein [Embleya sp. NBC_00896]
MSSASARPIPADRPPDPAARLRRFGALFGAGFRRWATYRQAAIAGLFTNTVFGVMIYSLMVALAADGRRPGGYDAAQLATYVWVGQGILSVVHVWSWNELADRVRSGEVTSDLLRPIDPFEAFLAADLGRAAYAVLARMLVPVLTGALFFTMYVPQRPYTLPLFALSLLLGTVLSFALRYLVNLGAFWLLDARGLGALWMLASGIFAGTFFPLRFLPDWAQALLWFGTPFPGLYQIPLDVLVERPGPAQQIGSVVLQLAWVAVLVPVVLRVQRAATDKLVIQGG